MQITESVVCTALARSCQIATHPASRRLTVSTRRRKHIHILDQKEIPRWSCLSRKSSPGPAAARCASPPPPTPFHSPPASSAASRRPSCALRAARAHWLPHSAPGPPQPAKRVGEGTYKRLENVVWCRKPRMRWPPRSDPGLPQPAPERNRKSPRASVAAGRSNCSLLLGRLFKPR